MALYYTSSTNAASPAQTSMTTAFKTAVNLSSQTAGSGITLSRAFIYEFEVGTSGLPNSTDCAIQWVMEASTAVGTGVSMTVTALDAADAASSHISTANHPTIEPTIASGVAQRWALAANQRASYRWVVNPGGPGELIIPATNVAGLAIRAKSSNYVNTFDAAVYFRE
jgi:hypothetical protein